jgi:hypothetical protein
MQERYAASGTIFHNNKAVEASGVLGHFYTDGEAQQRWTRLGVSMDRHSRLFAMPAGRATSSASGSAAVTHASTGSRAAGQRAATTSAANSTSSGVGAWIAGHAIAGVHAVGAMRPLARPANPRTAAIVYRRTVHRAVRVAADNLREGHTRSYQRRSQGGQDG